ncbi:low molecular weight protein-tyrosine-phosphatase [Lacinutrix undariae]
MTKILMVCLGNICRSPLAHGILESKLNSNSYFIDSAGTANYHVGKQADSRSIAVAKAHGINITAQRSRQFEVTDFEEFDYIFAMDSSNYQNIIALARNEKDIKKVDLILNLDPTILNKDVPDPYYDSDSGFKNVYNLLEGVCEKLAQKLILD